MTLAPLGSLVVPVASWNPIATASDEQVRYIDIGAVDNVHKRISGVQTMLGREAPSRARQLVEAGDVLVSTVRPNLNAVATVESELGGATASTGFCVLRPRPQALDSRYLLHWVKSPAFIGEMVRRSTGASYPAVSDGIVRESKIPLPPLPEQRRIAEVLDRAEALRVQRRQALAQLDALAESIFLHMFGDPATNARGWPQARLGDLVLSASDGPHVSPRYSASGVPFLSTRHVRKGAILWNDLKFISPEDAQIHWKKCKPARGDILYTKGGTTGLAALVKTDQSFAVWVHVALLKPDSKKVDSSWLESMLNGQHCYEQSQTLTRGIANRDLGLTRMINIEMFLPPLALQCEFAQRVARIEALKALHNAAQLQLDALFASLQHRAFRGEL